MTARKPFVRVKCQEYPDIRTVEHDLIVWAAGFIDGEGCISISRQKAKDHNHSGYTFGIAVSQKTAEPLERLKEMFGGHFFEYKSYGTVYYRWQQWSHGADNCVRALLPYLLVKRKIAEVCLRFQEQMSQWNAEYGRRGYPDFVVSGREVYYLQAKELNAKTKAKRSEPKYTGPQSSKNPNKNGGVSGDELVN